MYVAEAVDNIQRKSRFTVAEDDFAIQKPNHVFLHFVHHFY